MKEGKNTKILILVITGLFLLRGIDLSLNGAKRQGYKKEGHGRLFDPL